MRVFFLTSVFFAVVSTMAVARPVHRRSHTYHRHLVSSYRAPLMPPKEWEGVSVAAYQAPTAPARPVTPPPVQERATASSSGESWRLGFALGTLAHVNALPTDALNSQLFLGGRVSLLVPLTEKIWVRPAVGYFFRNESTTISRTFTNVFEGSVNLQYRLLGDTGLNLLVGISQSVQGQSDRRNGGALAAGNTSMRFSYHAGPSLGLLFDLTPGLALTIDSEATWDFSSPIQPFVGLLGGMLFRL